MTLYLLFLILLILSPPLFLIHLVILTLHLPCQILTYLPFLYLTLLQIYLSLINPFLFLHLQMFLFLILFLLQGSLPESLKLLLIYKIINAVLLFKITLFIPIQPSRLDPTPPFQVLNTLLSQYLDSSCLSPSYAHFCSLITAIPKPKSYNEAVKDPKWQNAMAAEIAILESNQT